NISERWDYVAIRNYDAFPKIVRAADVKVPGGGTWIRYLNRLREQADGLGTSLVVVRRVNPFSPNVHLMSFFSTTLIYPADQLAVLSETDETNAKAVCVILNSCLF